MSKDMDPIRTDTVVSFLQATDRRSLHVQYKHQFIRASQLASLLYSAVIRVLYSTTAANIIMDIIQSAFVIGGIQLSGAPGLVQYSIVSEAQKYPSKSGILTGHSTTEFCSRRFIDRKFVCCPSHVLGRPYSTSQRYGTTVAKLASISFGYCRLARLHYCTSQYGTGQLVVQYSIIHDQNYSFIR